MILISQIEQFNYLNLKIRSGLKNLKTQDDSSIVKNLKFKILKFRLKLVAVIKDQNEERH
jgi:hypothetical protein